MTVLDRLAELAANPRLATIETFTIDREDFAALVAVAQAARQCIAHKDGKYQGTDTGIVLAASLADALAPLERQP